MRIKKILNNNFVIVEQEREMILMGLGIAFNKKVGDLVEDYEVSKIFYLEDREQSDKLQKLLVAIPVEIVKLSESVISMIKMELGKKINDIIYVALIDHINSALNRYKENIVLNNTLLLDIKRFYPQEYKLGLDSVEKIHKSIGIDLGEDEAAFIALHIVNATMGDENSALSYQITKMMKEVLAIVRRFNRVEFDTNSLYYYRFVNHLRYFGQRLFSSFKHAESTTYDELSKIISGKYQLSFQCSKLIQEFLFDEYNTLINNEELMYLTIHIERILEEHNKKEKENV